ncbi:protein containing Cell wall hydrolase, SleB domain protein [gut metagenome]|uniref:Protein containing Cell wall hydrolase, SleB domain protein n=1 Tax=gut metagenome TaxID=749906 RepID=J9GA01_9ZZZZ
MISGVEETPVVGERVNRIGTSCEQVVVGQRVMTVKSPVPDLNVSETMESVVDDLDSRAMAMAESPTLMSDTDYDTLLRIVEAEAGGEDLKGRILVGNVIMNRVNHEEFPDTITEVVWEYKNGVPQFSPTYDGRINEVIPSDTTKEAVKQVMEGVDYSEGALFFLQKSESEEHSVSWFEKDLKRLFKHGVHEFYTYPEEGEKTRGRREVRSKKEFRREQETVKQKKSLCSPVEGEPAIFRILLWYFAKVRAIIGNNLWFL